MLNKTAPMKIKKICFYILIVGVIFLPGFMNYCKLYHQRKVNRVRLELLMQENRRLAEENRRLKDDPVFIEKTARENLGLAKPGEIVVKFVDKNVRFQNQNSIIDNR